MSNLDERTKIFDKVSRLVQTKHFNPALLNHTVSEVVQIQRPDLNQKFCANGFIRCALVRRSPS